MNLWPIWYASPFSTDVRATFNQTACVPAPVLKAYALPFCVGLQDRPISVTVFTFIHEMWNICSNNNNITEEHGIRMEQLENLTNFQFHNLNLGDELQYLDVNRKTILPHVLNKRFWSVTGEEPVADSCEHGFCKNDRDNFVPCSLPTNCIPVTNSWWIICTAKGWFPVLRSHASPSHHTNAFAVMLHSLLFLLLLTFILGKYSW